MPAKVDLDPQKAISHLKKIYNTFLKEGGKPAHFTIRQYNRLNKNPQMYIDVFVKKLGGWNESLHKAEIPLRFRQYKNYSMDDIAKYIKKVYQLFQQSEKINRVGKYENQEKTFRMRDFTKFSSKIGNKFSLAIILKRFGSWSNVLHKLNIPIGRSRGLSQKKIIQHLDNVYRRFQKAEKVKRVFSKEMYEKYNFIDDVYISSKLIERRFGTWIAAKRKLNII